MKHIQIEIHYEDNVWTTGLDFNESFSTAEEIVEQKQQQWMDTICDIPNFDNDKYSVNYFVLDLEE